MNHLHRELAPMTDAAWRRIDEEGSDALRDFLAGRRLVDFSGPHGWELASTATGALEPIADRAADVAIGLRAVQRLVEVRVPFVVDRETLREIDRGAPDVDLGAVIGAAGVAADIEDRAVFAGMAEAGITGCGSGSEHDPIDLGDVGELPDAAARAMDALLNAGVEGPYGLAVGPEMWRAVVASLEDGYPLARHLHSIIEGPVVRARAVDGAVLVSQRGGDFELVVGGDLSIGHLHNDADTVELYLTESFTFRNLEPSAAVAIRAG